MTPIPLHTGPRARFIRSAIDWRNRARAMRETLAEYRMHLPPRSPVTLHQQVLVAEADRRVHDLFSAAAGVPEGLR